MMRDRMAHRGPDDVGEWSDLERGIWLGHRRLSVIDLTPEGRQPMCSQSGRFVIVFNGEVFNFPFLRQELEALGYRFRGHSDTEVILAAIEAWGVETAVRRFVGMFSFAVYDRLEHSLWLARDPVGIKPLYYATRAGELAFASELSALKPLPWLNRELDLDALCAYFRYLCVPAPATILRGARKLRPGTILRWDSQGPREIVYWNLCEVVRTGLENPLTCSFGEAVDELEALLRESIRLSLVADVPLGAFLSGGVDSSTVVALMQSLNNRPVQTFTIGFAEQSHDESAYARAVAAHLGTEHHEYMLRPHQVLELVPQVSTFYDEPFADSSSVPTYLLSRFARQRVTVTLSGDGGDELFGGYPRYFWAERITRLQRCLGQTGARWLGRMLAWVPASWWDGPGSRLSRWFGGSGGLSARVRRFAGYLACRPERVYEEMVSAWTDPLSLLGESSTNRLGPDPEQFSELPWSDQMMAVDQGTHLPDDILTKLDRASMAVSLEARVPLLDHRIVEWSWRVPRAYKLAPSGDRGKLLLRAVLHRYVPRELIERPKMGFGMPLAMWLRQELREWAEDLLAPERLKRSEVLNPQAVRQAWSQHLAGVDRLPQLWTVLMFLEWQERWRT